jgi:H+/Cl- antiporter ClcA
MTQPTKLPNAIFPFMAHFLMPYKLYILGFIACALISGLYGIINATLTKVIIDLLEKTPDSTSLWRVIFWPALFLVLNFELHNMSWRGIGLINYKIQPVIKNNLPMQLTPLSTTCSMWHYECLSSKFA